MTFKGLFQPLCFYVKVLLDPGIKISVHKYMKMTCAMFYDFPESSACLHIGFSLCYYIKILPKLFIEIMPKT